MAAVTALALNGAAARPSHKSDPLKIPDTQLEPVAFADIDGWATDDHADAFATFLTSCRTILKSSATARAQRPPVFGALYEICQRAVAAVPLDDAGARTFFEQNFRGFRISPLGERDGFITGYYEPVVEGARLPSDVYTVPLYRRPPDLLLSRLRQHRAPKGKAGWSRLRQKAAPYFDRAQIEDGAIAGRGLEICYLKSPVDAFFVQIQGSTRVRLEDGSMLRLNYDAANGHPYLAVGRFLIERKIVAKEDMSMQRIRDWMDANPEEAKALRRENKSYVFFRETALTEEDEPAGAQGIALTAARSIAVDKNIHVYGMPFFLDAALPIASEKPETPFRRLMIAQDTGGAIVGPARADIYLGAGDEAERAAGRFKQFGRFVMLVPNEFDPAAETANLPLPPVRPVIPQTVVAANAKNNEKTESAKPADAAPVPIPVPNPVRRKQ